MTITIQPYGFKIVDSKGDVHHAVRHWRIGFTWVLPDGREVGPTTIKKIKETIEKMEKRYDTDTK